MNEHPLRSVLQRLIEGKLDAREQSDIEGHVEICIECQAAMDALTPYSGIVPPINNHDSAVRVQPTYITCPECHNQIEVGHGPAHRSQPGEVECAACGSRVCIDSSCRGPQTVVRQIGKFTVLDYLGAGAFGRVYKARDTELDRIVAIKMQRTGYMLSQDDVARFQREARSAARLRHQGIVSVFDAGQIDGNYYIVSEFVQGVTLDDFVGTKRFTFRQAAELIADVADAVQHAHEHGVIHRDLKPSNIMLQTVDRGNDSRSDTKCSSLHVRPMLMDFGLAKRDAAEITMTLDGQLLGTPAYMSPEQARGEGHKIDVRGDVYSLGVIFYELLTGELPFRGSSRMLIFQLLEDEPRSPRRINDKIPRDLETICLKAMAKDRSLRYSSAAELSAELRRWYAGTPIHARPLSAAGRLARWFGRNPLVATLAAAVFLALVLGTTISTYFAIKAENRAQLAVWRLYSSDMKTAQLAWHGGQIGITDNLLQRHGPESATSDLRGFEWYYLYRLCHGDLLTLKGHTGGIRTVAFSPDGRRLASGDGNGHIRIWDPVGGQQLLPIGGHNGSLNCLAFFPDGDRLVSAGGDCLLRIWDLDTGNQILPLTGHTAAVSSVAVSNDGQRIASSSLDGTIIVWNSVNGDKLFVPTGRMGRINGVAFSPDGGRLALAGGKPNQRGTVEVWDLSTGDTQLMRNESEDDFNGVAFSPNGEQIASGNSDGTINVWDAISGERLRKIVGHQGSVGIVAFSPNGVCLASSSSDGTIKVWNVTTGDILRTVRGHCGAVTCVAFSPDGRRLASGSLDNTTRVWDASTGDEPVMLEGSDSHLSCVVFSPDGQRLAASINEKVKVWNIRTREELFTLIGHTDEIDGLGFSTDGKRLASASDDGTLRVSEMCNGTELFTLRGHNGAVASVSFSPDGRLIVSAGGEPTGPGEVKIWSATNGKESLALEGHARFVRSVAFSPDGRRIATASIDRTIKLWDARTGRLLHTLPGHSGPVWCVAFSKDGRKLVSAGGEATKPGEVTVWDPSDGKKLLNFAPHTDRVWSVAFSPDGKRIASASDDDTIKVSDVETGEQLLTLTGRKGGGGITSVTFSPDGYRLAGVSWHGTITIWDATPSPLVASH